MITIILVYIYIYKTIPYGSKIKDTVYETDFQEIDSKRKIVTSHPLTNRSSWTSASKFTFKYIFRAYGSFYILALKEIYL